MVYSSGAAFGVYNFVVYVNDRSFIASRLVTSLFIAARL